MKQRKAGEIINLIVFELCVIGIILYNLLITDNMESTLLYLSLLLFFVMLAIFQNIIKSNKAVYIITMIIKFIGGALLFAYALLQFFFIIDLEALTITYSSQLITQLLSFDSFIIFLASTVGMISLVSLLFIEPKATYSAKIVNRKVNVCSILAFIFIIAGLAYYVLNAYVIAELYPLEQIGKFTIYIALALGIIGIYQFQFGYKTNSPARILIALIKVGLIGLACVILFMNAMSQLDGVVSYIIMGVSAVAGVFAIIAFFIDCGKGIKKVKESKADSDDYIDPNYSEYDENDEINTYYDEHLDGLQVEPYSGFDYLSDDNQFNNDYNN